MTEKQHVHIVGAAGNGMCAVAEVSLACGHHVTGSDRLHDRNNRNPVLQTLAHAGCILTAQDGSALSADTQAMVVSTAIEADNPDMLAAKKLGVPTYHRAEWLAKLIGRQPVLGVAGTSGKSTVTAMTGWILAAAGKQPFLVNGASVSAWESRHHTGHVCVGTRDLWVVELDESDRSLLRFSPQHAVITNESVDHFSVSETRALFSAFERQVSGRCLRGPWITEDYACTLDGCHFVHDGTSYALRVIGQHNAQNAIAASALCACVGVSPQESARALRTFPGVRRRLEKVSASGNLHVFDDYSHNPEKIAAALDAIMPLTNHLTVVWRPHGYGPLRKMMGEFASVFARLANTSGGQHRLLLLPVYDVGGTAVRDVQSGDLAVKVRDAGVETHCFVTYDDVVSDCADRHVQDRDAVIVMGARDPGLSGLARDIAKLHE